QVLEACSKVRPGVVRRDHHRYGNAGAVPHLLSGHAAQLAEPMASRQTATRSPPGVARPNGRLGRSFGRPRSFQAASVAAGWTAAGTWVWSTIATKAIPRPGLVPWFYRLWFAVPVLWLWVALSPGIRRRLGSTWLFASLGGGLLFSVHQVLFF